MNKDDKIADALGLVPLQGNEITVVDAPTENQESYDFETARQNIHHLLQKGNLALDELLNLASQSQMPRSYEVLVSLIKTLSDVNKDLLVVQEKKKELSVKNENLDGPQTVNQNLFVGSSKDLQELLEKLKK